MTDRLPTSETCERRAFYFESEGASLFAWLHTPRESEATHGVVICPPIGHEQVHTHGTLRHLADHLASKGFAVMRMDYHGTGDSAGDSKEADCLSSWLASVRDAVAWLRKQAGCEAISLVGLRFGATLAAMHATACGADNLVLWAPIVKGSRYVRELTALSRTAARANTSDTVLEAVGFAFTKEAINAIAGIDLLQTLPRCNHCLIMQPENAASQTSLRDQLVAAGVPVMQTTHSGYDQMMAEPHFAKVPTDALQSITEWFCQHSHATLPGALDGRDEWPREATMGATRETIHTISCAPHLFGIVTEPLHQTNRPWIVMLNAGAAHHIGPGRMYVELARHFAALGFPCLRMDLCGLGDSIIQGARRENDGYAATAFRDAALACDYLQRLSPGRPIVLMGLCSGAYVAFQAAAQLPHPALIESVLINPLTFFWREGMSLEASPTQQLQTWHYYWSIIFDWKNWRQMFSGDGLRSALQRFRQRMFPRVSREPALANGDSFEDAAFPYTHPAKENLAADLKCVAAASRTLAMFVSESDPGHFLLMYKARRRATQLMESGTLKCTFIKEADHTFSCDAWRSALSQALTRHLQERFPNAADSPDEAPCSERRRPMLQPSPVA